MHQNAEKDNFLLISGSQIVVHEGLQDGTQIDLDSVLLHKK